MRILIFTLVLLLGWLQYRLWVGEGSLAEVHALKADIARQTQELAQLRARNQALAAEVANLKSGNEALEERARMDLGMIKPGEVFLQVIEGQSATAKPGPQPEPKSGSKPEPKPGPRPGPEP
jgi:cell division protein FtsB